MTIDENGSNGDLVMIKGSVGRKWSKYDLNLVQHSQTFRICQACSLNMSSTTQDIRTVSRSKRCSSIGSARRLNSSCKVCNKSRIEFTRISSSSWLCTSHSSYTCASMWDVVSTKFARVLLQFVSSPQFFDTTLLVSSWTFGQASFWTAALNSCWTISWHSNVRASTNCSMG